MSVDVQERCLGQEPDAAPAAAPEVGEPRGLPRHRPLLERDAPDALHRDERFQILSAQRLDHGERPSRDRVPVAAKRVQIDGQAQLVHFGVVHPGAHVAPHELHPPEPFLVVEHLRPIGDEAVHAHVLDPRRVPEKPGDRVDSRIWGACLRMPCPPSCITSTTAEETGVGTPRSRPWATTKPFMSSISVGRPLATSWAIDARQFTAFPEAGVSIRSRASYVSRRSEEHTSELQSPCNLVCRLLLEKKKKKK